MQLRYSLNKKLYKNKKLPPKSATNEEHISADQRGDHTSADSEFLSLGKETVTKRIEDIINPNEDVSRRGLFSTLGALKKFSDRVDEKTEQKKPPRKKRRKKKKNGAAESPAETDSHDEEAPQEEIKAQEEAADTAPPPEEPPKKGFFKKIMAKLRPSPDVKEDLKAVDASPAALPAKPEPDEEIEEESDDEDVEMDRRNLLRQGIHFFAKPAVDSVQKKIDKVNAAVDKITRRVPLLRPPGAISEKAFLNACTRCDECVNACPKDAILKAPKKMGFLIMGSPYIDPSKNPCVMCDDLYCISACPDKALLPVHSPADVTMGYAILDKKNCQAYGITFCQQCVIDCPIPGAITQVDSKPVFHKKICTGCGVCVLSCSTVNIPVAIKIKPQMVIEYQAAKIEMEKKAALQKAEQKAAKEAAEESSTENSSIETADLSAEAD